VPETLFLIAIIPTGRYISAMPSPDPTSTHSHAQWFQPTHWSAVLAGGRNSEANARTALEELCRNYWPPLYAYIRRQGYCPQDAQDLTQDFFAWLLESDHLRQADPDRGKFRSFLLVRLKHFISNERRKAQAQKRGGRRRIISLELEFTDGGVSEPSASELTPEQAFDQRWAVTILDRSVARLRQEYADANRAQLFGVLKGLTSAEKDRCTYAEAAALLGLTESAVKSAAHRLRQRHRQLLREEILQTVAVPAEVDEELRYLISVIGR
jgi:RNA polymerase sigma-70 factor (ECF subfamily)